MSFRAACTGDVSCDHNDDDDDSDDNDGNSHNDGGANCRTDDDKRSERRSYDGRLDDVNLCGDHAVSVENAYVDGGGVFDCDSD